MSKGQPESVLFKGTGMFTLEKFKVAFQSNPDTLLLSDKYAYLECPSESRLGLLLETPNCFPFLLLSLLIVEHQTIKMCLPGSSDKGLFAKIWTFLTLNMMCISVDLADSIIIQHFTSSVNVSLFFPHGSNEFYTKNSKWSIAKID